MAYLACMFLCGVQRRRDSARSLSVLGGACVFLSLTVFDVLLFCGLLCLGVYLFFQLFSARRASPEVMVRDVAPQVNDKQRIVFAYRD